MLDFHPQLALAPNTRFPHIYVHLPFCEAICHYCDFYVARARVANHERLFRALATDLDRWRPFLADRVETLYFGGGTPSESPPELLAEFVRGLKNCLADDAEVCLEANPTSINPRALKIWRESGFERISIGVQSLQPKLLRKLSRKHSREQALQAIAEARAVFPNVSVDLMYGVPGQSVAELVEDAICLAQAGVDHLSAYTLTLEPKHFLFSQLPSSDQAMEASEALEAALRAQGLAIYEASNYARPGRESRHNHAYWLHRPYLALGPSAHGFDGGSVRWQNIADWQRYCELAEDRQSTIAGTEALSRQSLRTEHLFTRLRTRRGLRFPEYQAIFAEDLAELKAQEFSRLAEAGLGSLESSGWQPSFRGLMLADAIALRLEP